MNSRTSARALAALITAALVGGCSVATDNSSGDDKAEVKREDLAGSTVTLVAHQSFNLPKKLRKQFEKDTGMKLKVRSTGDAGELTNQLALTADNPIGDVAFGVDNTFASRALDEDVFATYEPKLPDGAEEYAAPEGADKITPIDQGSVCVNVDTAWFKKHDQEPPQTLDDLRDPAYEGLFVAPGAPTSSPGMAFLLATIAEYGDDWEGYWEDLVDNGLKITSGWSDAYFVDFTGGSDKGTRPIVVSYDSSPAFTVDDAGKKSSTQALLDTCIRQVEYAGVLSGAKNPGGAEAVIDWLLSDEVQAALPESMYVFPVSDEVELPAVWEKFAKRPDSPASVDPDEISTHRAEWLTSWTDITTR